MGKKQPAPGELELVRAFVNTLEIGGGRDALATPEQLRAWLRQNGLASPGVRSGSADLKRAIALREALRQILLSHNEGERGSAEAWRTVDQAAARLPLRVRFRDGQTMLEPDARSVDGALGRLLAIVHEAITRGTWTRLKACRLHSCEWAFYDHTKNGSGTWCNMAVCGNRAKARTYRARRELSRGS